MDASEHHLIDRLVTQTVGLLQTEYPNGIRLTMSGPMDEPIRPSRIYPAFFGCYDWHSSVHSHWQLVRALRTHPTGSFVDAASNFLHGSLTTENIAVEMQWVEGRPTFEMPYGMAWLLALCGELRAWDSPDARAWRAALLPLERHAIDQFHRYCERLTLPVRGGMHNQSAFSLGLVWDAAVRLGDAALGELVGATARRLYLQDTEINLAYEPSAADFLSPSLSEADLLCRLLTPPELSAWLSSFVPDGFTKLTPVEVVDPSDGQLAHWAGLNLSRSWMLERLAVSLPPEDPAIAQLQSLADEHAGAGLPMAANPEYMVSHWVPTFAVYLLTR